MVVTKSNGADDKEFVLYLVKILRIRRKTRSKIANLFLSIMNNRISWGDRKNRGVS